ncbi:hypothetical protein N656DRAFT_766161 [Canariomyces notabilis]|uniref:Uncharacterized protein n=1 Tax=Canariomyces notabilis TaxID=2074819 RepID=A0AAN6YWV6_9PEZI|nr:hypothetical protein N656DRAFT_766161 [Canariomyces arenarius]
MPPLRARRSLRGRRVLSNTPSDQMDVEMGDAHDDVFGGFSPSVAPSVASSVQGQVFGNLSDSDDDKENELQLARFAFLVWLDAFSSSRLLLPPDATGTPAKRHRPPRVAYRSSDVCGRAPPGGGDGPWSCGAFSTSKFGNQTCLRISSRPIAAAHLGRQQQCIIPLRREKRHVRQPDADADCQAAAERPQAFPGPCKWIVSCSISSLYTYFAYHPPVSESPECLLGHYYYSLSGSSPGPAESPRGSEAREEPRPQVRLDSAVSSPSANATDAYRPSPVQFQRLVTPASVRSASSRGSRIEVAIPQIDIDKDSYAVIEIPDSEDEQEQRAAAVKATSIRFELFTNHRSFGGLHDLASALSAMSPHGLAQAIRRCFFGQAPPAFGQGQQSILAGMAQFCSAQEKSFADKLAQIERRLANVNAHTAPQPETPRRPAPAMPARLPSAEGNAARAETPSTRRNGAAPKRTLDGEEKDARTPANKRPENRQIWGSRRGAAPAGGRLQLPPDQP